MLTIEHQWLMHLAKEYKKRNYRVSLYPDDERLPESLKRFSVGLIAGTDEELVVADVRIREQLVLEGAKDLSEIARQVKMLSNSHFALIAVNSNTKLI